MKHEQWKAISNSRMEFLIDEFIHNKRNRKIMKLHFIDGESYDAIAGDVGITARHVSNVIDRCCADLAEYLF